MTPPPVRTRRAVRESVAREIAALGMERFLTTEAVTCGGGWGACAGRFHVRNAALAAPAAMTPVMSDSARILVRAAVIALAAVRASADVGAASAVVESAGMRAATVGGADVIAL